MAAAGRRTSLASLAGQKVEDVPGRGDLLLLSLPLDKLTPTRFNPRRRFGTDEELAEFGRKLAKKQLQPAVVVSRAAYLKLWPDEADRVGQVPYVIANGERRYRASLLVGRPALDVVHNEDVAKTRADFLDAVQSENNDRTDLDPIERAIAIETMVSELGGADRVAAYYDKTKGWVSQQRKLLRLTRELQDLVSAGEMPVRVARDIASLPQEEQAPAWQQELERRRLEKQTAAHRRAETAPRTVPAPAPRPEQQAGGHAAAEPSRFTAVNQTAGTSPPAPTPPPSPNTPAAAVPERFTAVNQQSDPPPGPQPAPQADPRRLPEARTGQEAAPAGAASPAPPRLPYDDGTFIGQHLAVKMQPEPYLTAVQVINRQCWDKTGPEASLTVLRSMLETARQHDPDSLRLLLKDLEE